MRVGSKLWVKGERCAVLYVAEAWKKAYPMANVGLMVLRNVINPERNDALENCKQRVETEIRTRFPNRGAVMDYAPIKAYSEYYKRFGKTYHVQHQLESVGFKGKTMPRVAGLVEAMFMAELKNGILTAGHDYNALKFPLTLTVAVGNEQYVLMNGKEQSAKSGDMMIADGEGIISSIIYGPDLRTRIVSGTDKAVFVVYAPAGIPTEDVSNHLTDIYSFVQLVAPETKIELQEIYQG